MLHYDRHRISGENPGNKFVRENILQIADSFVAAVHPLRIILFGSSADGTYTDESDYDFTSWLMMDHLLTTPAPARTWPLPM